MNCNKNSLILLKDKALNAIVGTFITCPSCGNIFKKPFYLTVFCKLIPGTECKDNFWNHVNNKELNFSIENDGRCEHCGLLQCRCKYF